MREGRGGEGGSTKENDLEDAFISPGGREALLIGGPSSLIETEEEEDEEEEEVGD